MLKDSLTTWTDGSDAFVALEDGFCPPSSAGIESIESRDMVVDSVSTAVDAEDAEWIEDEGDDDEEDEEDDKAGNSGDVDRDIDLAAAGDGAEDEDFDVNDEAVFCCSDDASPAEFGN